MRRIYFIRHARPDIPFGERWCVGSRTDFPLGTYGLIQASLLSFEPELKNLDTVFCSSLSRARETALSISPSPVMIPGLEEQDMGEWDGLSFAEIMKGWPELYAAREAGMHPVQCTWFHERAFEPHIPCPILDEFEHADTVQDIIDLVCLKRQP